MKQEMTSFSHLVEQFRQWKKDNRKGPVTISDIKSLKEEYNRHLGKTALRSRFSEKRIPSKMFEARVQRMVDSIDSTLNKAKRMIEKGVSKHAIREELEDVLGTVDSIETKMEDQDISPAQYGDVVDLVEDILSDVKDLAKRIGMKICDGEECEDDVGENDVYEGDYDNPLLESFSKADKKAILKLVEATRSLNRAKKLFEEVDDAAMLQEPLDNAAQATNDASTISQASDNVKEAIANIQNEINQLATTVGIEPVVDTGANPEANVPPVTDANAANVDPSQMNESVSAIRKRMVERRARFESNRKMKEAEKNGGIPHIIDSLIDATGFPGDVKIPGASPVNGDPDRLGTRPLKTDLKGDGTAVRWPNKKLEQNPDLALNLKGQVQSFKRRKMMKESAEDRHVSEFIKKNELDFKSIFKNGVLNT